MISTGTTAVSTPVGSDASTTLLPAVNQILNRTTVMNSSGTPCFVSFDAGINWLAIPANCYARTFDITYTNTAVLIKRVPSGADVIGIYADAVYIDE